MDNQIVDGGADAPEQEQELSLRESLVEQFAQAREKQESDAGEDGEPARAERLRGEGGRFVAKPGAAAPEGQEAAPAAAAAEAQAPAAAATPDQQQSQAAAAPVDVAAPQSWTAEAKAKWAEVPPEVRRYIAEREEQVHRQFSRNDEERTFGRTMSQTLQPYMETLRAINATPDQAVAGLLNVDAVLRKGSPEQKLEMVHEIMRSYQIPIDAVFNHQPMPQDPRLQSLQQQMQAMQQQLQQGQQQKQTAAEEEAARIELATFKANAPHLEAVRDVMANLLTSGMATGLQDAYDQAVWANPETRKLMMAQQTAAISQTRRVEKARAAGSSLSGAPGGAVPTKATPNRSLRDELKANFGEATNRI